MKTHSFRWEGLAFGLLFLSVAGSWAVWEQDLLTPRQFSFTASGVLILLGLVGVAATLWQSRPPRPIAATPPDEVEDAGTLVDEAADPTGPRP